MEVTLLGTGDTAGTPAPGCDCSTCERARSLGVERTRFSVHVANPATGEALLVDASPDFRQQFLDAGCALPDAVVVTHVHFDHLDGLGNLYRLVDHAPVYAADAHDDALGTSVAAHVRDRYDYLDTVTVAGRSPFEPFDAAGLRVTLVPVVHPPFATYGLLVEDPATGGRLAISGDTAYDVPDQSRATLADADLALVDGIVHADYCTHHPAGGAHPGDDGVPRTFGSKHMTLTGARAFADEIGADDYRVVHVSHEVAADEAFADDLAVDGEQFSL